MQGKRGLSAVVTTLVIILLVLVAIGIVWAVVSNILESGSDQIGIGQFTLDLEIKSVGVQEDNITVDVVIERNKGNTEVIGMNFIFSNGTDTEIIREDTVLEKFEKKSFKFVLTKFSATDLKSVSVAPIYESASGKESVGNVADSFEVTESMRSAISGDVILEPQSNFEKMGYAGAGKVEYGPFSSGVPKLPEFKRAIVDPLDVLPGDNQTFTVHVYSPSGVINVTTTTELDNSTLNLDLQEIGEEGGNQIFSATWIVNDVHTTTYRTHITATDAEGNSNSITLTWTDSCQSQLTQGTTETLTSSCSTGGG